MADQRNGGIAWTEESWNPIRGCSRISPGCGGGTPGGGGGCYAERQAIRHAGPGQPYEGLVKSTTDGPRWTGVVRTVPEHLGDPLRWTRPRRVFVNSMSDLFHEGLSTDEIAAIFGVMAASERHTFQVLTKRAQRMCSWFEQVAIAGDVQVVRAAAHALWPPALDEHPEHVGNKYNRRHFLLHAEAEITWPPPNVWLGVSVENQRAADDRIPNLLATPAAVRWLSVEPMLGPVQIPDGWLRQLSWIVIGGESGPGARPFDLAWARELVKACRAAGVPVFVKQLGAVPVVAEPEWREAWKAVEAGGDIRGPGVLLSASNKNRAPAGFVPISLHDKKGADPLEWPEDLRVREYPAAPAVAA